MSVLDVPCLTPLVSFNGHLSMVQIHGAALIFLRKLSRKGTKSRSW